MGRLYLDGGCGLERRKPRRAAAGEEVRALRDELGAVRHHARVALQQHLVRVRGRGEGL